jgi:branched-chain amino acid aminotransferase
MWHGGLWDIQPRCNVQRMTGLVYVNGVYESPNKASVSVFDRGFLYGDSVFETLRVYEGVPFKLRAHIERLFQSGARVGFPLPWSYEHLASVVQHTLHRSGLQEAYMRLIATRGVGGTMGLDPALATDPTLIAMALPLPPLPEHFYTQGRTAALVGADIIGERGTDPAAKTGQYLQSVMATQYAKSQGCDEAVRVDAQGRVSEASAANVFACFEGVWCTPPLHVGILSGITRATLLEAGAREGVPMQERVFTAEDIVRAEEVFLCASVREVVPVVKIGLHPIGDGKVGPKVLALKELFQQEVQRYLHAYRTQGLQ